MPFQDRMWRKTRVPYGICYGADPNRNWGYRWNTGGTSDHPCSEIYCGPHPYSEPSVSALAKFVSQVAETEDLLAYLSIHSYSQMILLPYGYTSEHLDNYYPMVTFEINIIYYYLNLLHFISDGSLTENKGCIGSALWNPICCRKFSRSTL